MLILQSVISVGLSLLVSLSERIILVNRAVSDSLIFCWNEIGIVLVTEGARAGLVDGRELGVLGMV